jgi:HK97 family phage prohead protease
MTERTEHSYAPFEYKFTDTNGDPAGTFEGYGAFFNNIDEGGDRLLHGAFVDTLAQSKATGKMPKMLLNHGGIGMSPDDLLPIGKWNAMSEDTQGLASKGRLINLDTESGKRIYGAMKERELDSLSMGYKAIKFTRGTRAGEPKRTLSAVKLYEVSPVTFPMNGLAGITSVKSGSIKTVREFEDFLRDVGKFSHYAAKAIAARGFKSSEPRDEDGAFNDLLATLKSVRAGLPQSSS